MIKKDAPTDAPSLRRVQWRSDKIQWAESRGLPTAPLGTSLTVVKRLMRQDLAVLVGEEAEQEEARERGRLKQKEIRERQRLALWNAIDRLAQELKAVNQSERNLASQLHKKIKRTPDFAREIGLKGVIGVRQCRNLIKKWRNARQQGRN